MPERQEVQVTVVVSAPVTAEAHEIASAVERRLAGMFGETEGGIVIEVREERHIYGTAEEGDLPWRKDP